MRRKLTTPDLPADDLPDLTDQQRKFVEGLLSGKRASDAYRAAYNCENMLPNSIWCAASKLRADANVAQWLAAARKAGLGEAVVTLQSHLGELERLREIAIESGNVGAAVQAEQLRGKVGGHYVEQYRDLTRDPADILREIAAANPSLAAKLAAEQGIEWNERPTAH